MKKIIREMIKKELLREGTFYYHSKGQDGNGNNGPTTKDKKWIKIQANSFEQAFKKLPTSEQTKIKNAIKKYKEEAYYEERPGHEIEDFIGASAGWGVGFSFLSQDDWDAEKENE